jgi:hypothetical protein
MGGNLLSKSNLAVHLVEGFAGGFCLFLELLELALLPAYLIL